MKKVKVRTVIGGLVVLGTCIVGGVLVAEKINPRMK